MKLHLRLDDITSEHVRETLFIDGRNAGSLCLSIGEYQWFGAALLLGAERTKGNFEVTFDKPAWDSDGHFCMPSRNNNEN